MLLKLQELLALLKRGNNGNESWVVRDHDERRLGSLPMATPRYRCSLCGNLTRFDVVTTSTVKAFYHYNLGGGLTIEDAETLNSSVDEVSCRWCGHGNAIETVDEITAADDAVPSEQ